MRLQGATEVVLEAETHNAGALAMYEGLGFIRDKRLERCVHPPSHQSVICNSELSAQQPSPNRPSQARPSASRPTTSQAVSHWGRTGCQQQWFPRGSQHWLPAAAGCVCVCACAALHRCYTWVHAVTRHVRKAACRTQVLPEWHGRLPVKAAAAGAAGGSGKAGSTSGGGCRGAAAGSYGSECCVSADACAASGECSIVQLCTWAAAPQTHAKPDFGNLSTSNLCWRS